MSFSCPRVNFGKMQEVTFDRMRQVLVDIWSLMSTAYKFNEQYQRCSLHKALALFISRSVDLKAM